MATMTTRTVFMVMALTFAMSLFVTLAFPMRMLVAMTASAVAVTVVMTANRHSALLEDASQQARYGIVRQSGQAAKQFDPLSRKCALGAAADAAAQENINVVPLKETRQGTMARALGINYLS